MSINHYLELTQGFESLSLDEIQKRLESFCKSIDFKVSITKPMIKEITKNEMNNSISNMRKENNRLKFDYLNEIKERMPEVMHMSVIYMKVEEKNLDKLVALARTIGNVSPVADNRLPEVKKYFLLE